MGRAETIRDSGYQLTCTSDKSVTRAQPTFRVMVQTFNPIGIEFTNEESCFYLLSKKTSTDFKSETRVLTKFETDEQKGWKPLIRS